MEYDNLTYNYFYNNLIKDNLVIDISIYPIHTFHEIKYVMNYNGRIVVKT
jgi:hypothetical protein